MRIVAGSVETVRTVVVGFREIVGWLPLPREVRCQGGDRLHTGGSVMRNPGPLLSALPHADITP